MRRLLPALSVVAAFLVVGASPASAHGVGERADLPLPLGFFTWGAAIALIISFVALRVLWPRPRLDEASEGRPLPNWVQAAAPVGRVGLRVVGLGLYLVVLTAAWLGLDTPAANIAPVSLYVVFWVGGPILAAAAGDVWAVLNPFDTIVAGWERLRPGRAKDLPTVSGGAVGFTDHPEIDHPTGADVDGDEDGADDPGFGHWTAAAGIFSFVWVELAYHDAASPRAVAVWLTLYSAVNLAGALRWGRGWLRFGEGFAALFGLIAHLSPFFRGDDGRLRLRAPLSGLSDVILRPGTPALILVTLGSTGYDGLSGTRWWADLVGQRQGWDATIVATLGLLWVIALVAGIWYGANALVGRIGERDGRAMAEVFAPSLIPIVLAYSIAHYFSLLVFEGQDFYALASDPYGQGWDLFGTATNAVNYTAVSTATIAWVQAASIVAGHILGVVSAHDRAVSIWEPRRAERTQYPLLFVMIVYTVGGLAILLGA
jgi:hypothetical protein